MMGAEKRANNGINNIVSKKELEKYDPEKRIRIPSCKSPYCT